METLASFLRRAPRGWVRGSSPALASDGTLVCAVHVTHGTALAVARPGKRLTHIGNAPSGGPFFGPGDRLYSVGRRDRRSFVIVGFGEPDARVIYPPTARRHGVVDPSIAISERGMIAYRDHDGWLGIVTSTGRVVQTYRTEWLPMAWSPDGRVLLAVDAHARQGRPAHCAIRSADRSSADACSCRGRHDQRCALVRSEAVP